MGLSNSAALWGPPRSVFGERWGSERAIRLLAARRQTGINITHDTTQDLRPSMQAQHPHRDLLQPHRDHRAVGPIGSIGPMMLNKLSIESCKSWARHQPTWPATGATSTLVIERASPALLLFSYQAPRHQLNPLEAPHRPWIFSRWVLRE